MLKTAGMFEKIIFKWYTSFIHEINKNEIVLYRNVFSDA